jgi:hypothetical protein
MGKQGAVDERCGGRAIVVRNRFIGASCQHKYLIYKIAILASRAIIYYFIDYLVKIHQKNQFR